MMVTVFFVTTQSSANIFFMKGQEVSKMSRGDVEVLTSDVSRVRKKIRDPRKSVVW